MRRRGVIGACLVVVLAASMSGGIAGADIGPNVAAPGDEWPQFRGGPWHGGVNPYETVLGPANVSGLTVAWLFHYRGNNVSSPVVRNGVVYVGSTQANSLFALSASDGTVKWTAPTSVFVDTTPAVARGFALVGDGNGVLYAFRTGNGSLAWSAQTGGKILGSPTVVGEVVYVGSLGKGVYAYDIASGRLLWRARLDDEVYGSPTVADGSLFIGTRSGTLYALDAGTGGQRWTYRTPRGGSIFDSAAVRNGVVYAGSWDGAIFALDAATGGLRWLRQPGGSMASSPAVVDGVVYLGRLTAKRKPLQSIEARRASDGGLIWSHTYGNLTGFGVTEPSPTVANGVVYAGSLDGTLRAYAADDGALLWHYTAGGAFFASPAVADGQLFITGGAGGSLYKFALP